MTDLPQRRMTVADGLRLIDLANVFKNGAGMLAADALELIDLIGALPETQRQIVLNAMRPVSGAPRNTGAFILS